MGNVGVAWEDVISVIQMIQTHLIVIGVALAVMIVVMFAAKRWKKPLRGLIRWQSLFAFVVVLALTLNLALTDTLYNTLNVVLTDKGQLSPEHVEKSRQIVEDVTNEGVILTKNTEGYLPIAPQKINVFGWASTNPIYIAELIRKETKADLFEIVPRQAYANVYETVRDRAEQEQEQDARPAIKNEIKNISQYDTIYVGYPKL